MGFDRKNRSFRTTDAGTCAAPAGFNTWCPSRGAETYTCIPPAFSRTLPSVSGSFHQENRAPRNAVTRVNMRSVRIRTCRSLIQATGIFLVATWTGGPAVSAGGSPQVLLPGTRWETPYRVEDSGVPGPVVMVIGGQHGDEPAGAWAAREIGSWPILRGTIVLLPRANIPALYAASHDDSPRQAARADLDREFPAPANRSAAVESLSGAIWGLVADAKPDWLVDLREVGETADLAPQGTVSAADESSAAAASRLLAAVNATIPEPSRRFTAGEPPAGGSLAAAAQQRLPTHAIVFRTVAKDQPLALRIRQHRIMLHALLEHLGMLDPTVPVDRIVSGGEHGDEIRLAIYAGPGTRKGMHHLIQEMEQMPRCCVLPVGAEEINAGVLQHCNVILFPGGSGTRQGEALGNVDRRQIRNFVENGGGYVGICAGAYLATTNWPNSLGILDAQNYSSQWKRGRGLVRMELTPKGREILGTDQLCCDVRYHNGPILVPSGGQRQPDYQSLAVFRSEVAEFGPKGMMIGAPAIVASEFGKGRVLCFSPHPDQTKGLEELVRRGVRWTAKCG